MQYHDNRYKRIITEPDGGSSSVSVSPIWFRRRRAENGAVRGGLEQGPWICRLCTGVTRGSGCRHVDQELQEVQAWSGLVGT